METGLRGDQRSRTLPRHQHHHSHVLALALGRVSDSEKEALLAVLDAEPGRPDLFEDALLVLAELRRRTGPLGPHLVSELAGRIVSASKVERVRMTHADELRSTLTEILTPDLDEFDPVPHAAIEQAKQRAKLRTNLLASGAFTIAALADGRGQSLAAVRQWVHRARRRGGIFTVKHDGEALVPAFLLDEDLEPRPEYVEVIEALTAVGSDGWALWAWFTSPTGWLDGKVPAEHALIDAAAVIRAAERRASNAA